MLLLFFSYKTNKKMLKFNFIYFLFFKFSSFEIKLNLKTQYSVAKS